MGNTASNAANSRRWLAYGAMAVFSVWAAIPAGAQVRYVGSVLYPLTLPSPFIGQDAYSADAGQAVGYGIVSAYSDYYDHAIVWSGPGGSAVDLNPTQLPAIEGSYAIGTNGTQQVGSGYIYEVSTHALLWNGTAASAVDLTPSSGVFNADAVATDGVQQVGSERGENTDGFYEAYLWSGTAASAINLAGRYIISYASGISGSQEVGSGVLNGGDGFFHALLWSGTAESVVDLNPAGFATSEAIGTNGTEQVGDGDNHALLWFGTAASAVDLNPAGFATSEAISTNGTEQVGDGVDADYNEHAFLWSGSAASAIDLQYLLPEAGTWTGSYADSIDSDGNVFGLANGTFNGVTGKFAVEWSPVPEPGTLALMAAGGCLLLKRRRVANRGVVRV